MSNNAMQSHVSAALTENIGTHIEKEKILAETNHLANMAAIKNQQESQRNKEDADSWQAAAIQAKKEANFYKELLSQPMHVIAANNEEFKKTYDLQQELLATWMVSQKAFKELAIDLGIGAGMDRKEVVEKGMANKEKVLNNTTLHDNNAEDSNIIKPHIENLKLKLK